VLWSSNLQQKREVVRNHSEDEEMESQEEEEESFGKFTLEEDRRDVPDRSSMDLQCKKIFPSPARMSLTKLSLAGNNQSNPGHREFNK
jgi:hypothetical protein